MVRRHISDELKEMALFMFLQGLTDPEVRDFTGISKRSLKRLRSNVSRHRGVSRDGRPRPLKFLCDYVEAERELREAFDAETSLQTISRTLQRAGGTMQTVRRSALERN
ncbi:hypothetical protein EDB83DRAFT_1984866 [Lactarius deliciosus]|nr:hypothetical protein EDB83DRAFT_1984866 [Lactarius deliciosus]